ncbi:unnamed protein product [Arctogadus glacialis]
MPGRSSHITVFKAVAEHRWISGVRGSPSTFTGLGSSAGQQGSVGEGERGQWGSRLLQVQSSFDMQQPDTKCWLM